jgi:hypothetical protein
MKNEIFEKENLASSLNELNENLTCLEEIPKDKLNDKLQILSNQYHILFIKCDQILRKIQERNKKLREALTYAKS